MFFKEGRSAFLEAFADFDTRDRRSRFQLILVNFSGAFSICVDKERLSWPHPLARHHWVNHLSTSGLFESGRETMKLESTIVERLPSA